MIWLIKFFLSFSSIAFELLLAQALVAFWQDTVLCYSVTIGLFLFSMSLGAAFIDRYLKNSFRTLWFVQMALVFTGSLGLGSLFLVDHLSFSNGVVVVWAYVIMAVLGCLAGSTVPLLVKIAEEKKGPSRNAIIGADYAGHFFGSLAFVFLFYPFTGIIQAVFFVTALMALSGVMILGLMKHEGKSLHWARAIQILMLCVIMGAFAFWSLIEGALMRFYIR